MTSRLGRAWSAARNTRLIVDREPRLGTSGNGPPAYDVGAIKEQVAREYVLSRPGRDLRFLDLGARDGRLEYLLGIRENLEFDDELYARNLAAFQAKYDYWGMDIEPADDDGQVIYADITSDTLAEDLPGYDGFFDVIYSNNVFEHLRRPWIAASNLLRLLKPGGICITIAPFAIRYHESPADYFRYTHEGLSALFEDSGPVNVLLSAYDITGRRNDWQGTGLHRDICPEDGFGAWRENWFVVNIVEKAS